MRIGTQDDKDGLETRGEEETSCNSPLHPRTWQLESVSARPPSTGPGLYFNASKVDSFDIKTYEKANVGDGRHQLNS